MKSLFSLLSLLLIGFSMHAQVGINNTDPKASLDISASNATNPSNTDGILIPRIEDFPGVNPTANQQGMMVYLTTTSGSNPPGFYYWDNNAGPAAWISIVGNTIEKIDDLTDGKSDNDGTDNGSSIFLGVNAGAGDDSTDNRNVGIGFSSLASNTTGISNIGVGYRSLEGNVTGLSNIAIGSQALYFNTAGSSNLAIGHNSLSANSGSNFNTVIGDSSFSQGVSPTNNVGVGLRAGFFNSGSNNVFLGMQAGEGAWGSTVSNSIFLGYQAGFNETNNSKLYIENSSANADNALIYGEFDNDILRTNSEFQIGNPTGTGYAFPTSDGSTGQVLATDGAGSISFTTLTTGSGTLDEAYDYGGAGAGRDIIADNGAVYIQGADGLRVEGNIIAAENIVHDGDANTSISFTPDRIEIDAGGVNYIDIENTNSEITINEGSNAINFRVESDNENNMLLVHGTNNAIGIGENNPNSPLEIGIETPFDLNVANSGQDGIFIIGNNGSGLNGIGGSISFGGAHSARKNSRRAAISSLQTGVDEDNVGLAFYIHQGPVNTNPMVEGMRLTHQRYLGINNSSPSANLDVIGTMQFEDGNESAGFVLASDASGNATWTDPSTLITPDDDWITVGADIERQLGDVYIGNTNSTDNDLYLSDRLVDWDDLTYFVDPAGDTRMNEIQFDNGTAADPSIRFSDLDTGFYSPSNGTTAYSANGSEAFIIQSNGKITFGSAVSSTYDIYMKNSFNSKILSIGANNTDNNPIIDASLSGDSATSVINANVLSVNRNFSHTAIKTTSQIGDVYASISENVGNRVYGFRSIISEDNTIGDKIGVYSEATKLNSYAGYFLGRVSIGTTVGNTYTLPDSRGTNGQIMETDASGNVSWADPISDTDNQTIDNLGILSDNLGISLEDDGQAIQTVDLSTVSFNVSNFALAKMNMSALQILPVSAWTKLNFDATDFDIDTSFNSTTDRFEVADAGYYQISASYRSTTNILTNDLFGISVYVNGAAVRTEIINHHGSGVIVRNVKTIESLSVGDYIEIYYFSNAALTVTNSTLYTTFEVERIR